MQENELSSFRSAIEWPELRPKAEEATGELTHISRHLISAIDTLASAYSIAPYCESPIEIDLGAQLAKAINLVSGITLSLEPQYVLGPFRYDFALVSQNQAKPLALIECDGREFHSTEAQLANDDAKNALAVSQGIPLFRFSGSEIFRNPKRCALQILRSFGLETAITEQR